MYPVPPESTLGPASAGGFVSFSDQPRWDSFSRIDRAWNAPGLPCGLNPNQRTIEKRGLLL